jgi:PrtD family type I secretion system ABC transporter
MKTAPTSGEQVQGTRSILALGLSSCRAAVLTIAVSSGVLSVLYLTGTFFMLEVYDRIIPSRSIPTLVAISALAAALFAFQGILDAIRSRILTRVGLTLDEALSGRVFDIIVGLPLKSPLQGDGLQPLRDLDQARSFLSSQALAAFCDLPWIPIYVAICFAFHFWIGATALIGATILIMLTLLTDAITRSPSKASVGLLTARNAVMNGCRRNAEVVQAMGMRESLARSWAIHHRNYLKLQLRIADRGGTLTSITRVLRLALQCCVLAVGAYLVIYQQATAGIVVASSILVSRALAPVELAISHWKGFVATRQSLKRLTELMGILPSQPAPMELPAPKQSLSIEAATIVPPGGDLATVRNVSFTLTAGAGLGIVGPSGSGKTSLARALVGAWSLHFGKIRLDGATLDQWSSGTLGANIGYLPQDVELFAGTVAQNIARFESDPAAADVLAAAKAAGVHDLITRLPNGYQTQIGEGGSALSAGQRQRIGLARALYKDPFLVVLDEPNSNLDASGDEALTNAIRDVRLRRGIVIVISHRPGAVAAVDRLLLMKDGQALALGPKDEIMRRLTRDTEEAPHPQVPSTVATLHALPRTAPAS